MKFSTYAGISILISAATISHAWSTRVHYYPTVVFLSTNKVSQMVLGNTVIVFVLAIWRILRRLFLGTLRDVEREVLYDNFRYTITETCLALPVFRQDLSTFVLAMFTGLLFMKSFHWLAQSRVEHIEQAGPRSTMELARLVCMVLILLVVDVCVVCSSINALLVESPSVLILFGFEFAILGVAALATLVRFLLHVIDTQMEGTWHAKSTCTMLLEFVTEVLRFLFYLVFFGIIFTFYGIPLHIVRDLWVSYTNLRRRLQAFNRYRELTANMDQRFPDATEEELEECERTCIICRDAMSEGKKLPCGHIFHVQCLRLWLQQQQTCPTCRAQIPSQSAQQALDAAAARAAQEPVRAAGAAGAAPAGPGPGPGPGPVPDPGVAGIGARAVGPVVAGAGAGAGAGAAAGDAEGAGGGAGGGRVRRAAGVQPSRRDVIEERMNRIERRLRTRVAESRADMAAVRRPVSGTLGYTGAGAAAGSQAVSERYTGLDPTNVLQRRQGDGGGDAKAEADNSTVVNGAATLSPAQVPPTPTTAHFATGTVTPDEPRERTRNVIGGAPVSTARVPLPVAGVVRQAMEGGIVGRGFGVRDTGVDTNTVFDAGFGAGAGDLGADGSGGAVHARSSGMHPLQQGNGQEGTLSARGPPLTSMRAPPEYRNSPLFSSGCPLLALVVESTDGVPVRVDYALSSPVARSAPFGAMLLVLECRSGSYSVVGGWVGGQEGDFWGESPKMRLISVLPPQAVSSSLPSASMFHPPPPLGLGFPTNAPGLIPNAAAAAAAVAEPSTSPVARGAHTWPRMTEADMETVLQDLARASADSSFTREAFTVAELEEILTRASDSDRVRLKECLARLKAGSDASEVASTRLPALEKKISQLEAGGGGGGGGKSGIFNDGNEQSLKPSWIHKTRGQGSSISVREVLSGPRQARPAVGRTAPGDMTGMPTGAGDPRPQGRTNPVDYSPTVRRGELRQVQRTVSHAGADSEAPTETASSGAGAWVQATGSGDVANLVGGNGSEETLRRRRVGGEGEGGGL